MCILKYENPFGLWWMNESELRRNALKKKKLRLNTAGQIFGLGLASSAGDNPIPISQAPNKIIRQALFSSSIVAISTIALFALPSLLSQKTKRSPG
jgi:hypothetical protein